MIENYDQVKNHLLRYRQTLRERGVPETRQVFLTYLKWRGVSEQQAEDWYTRFYRETQRKP